MGNVELAMGNVNPLTECHWLWTAGLGSNVAPRRRFMDWRLFWFESLSPRRQGISPSRALGCIGLLLS